MYNKEQVYFHGKPIGYILYFGNEVTYHTFREYMTFFRMYRGFGISEEVLDYLKKKGVQKVVIHYEGKRENALFIAPLEKFFSGKEYTDTSAGFKDKQRHLSVEEFEKVLTAKKTE